MSRFRWLAWLAIVVFASCGRDAPPAESPERVTATSPIAPTGEVESPGAERSARPRIVVLGDSLTAGLGLSPDRAYPGVLQARLDAEHFDFEVVSAGVSGDTSAGGVSRLTWALEGDVRILVVALGGNDGLRGLPVDELARNLATIVETAQSRGIRVILAGMEAPPNFGAAYTGEFRAAYRQVAERFDVPLIPFLLEGVAGVPSLNQPDGIHPTEAGAVIVADTVWAVLGPMVEESARRSAGPGSSSGS